MLIVWKPPPELPPVPPDPPDPPDPPSSPSFGSLRRLDPQSLNISAIRHTYPEILINRTPEILNPVRTKAGVEPPVEGVSRPDEAGRARSSQVVPRLLQHTLTCPLTLYPRRRRSPRALHTHTRTRRAVRQGARLAAAATATGSNRKQQEATATATARTSGF